MRHYIKDDAYYVVNDQDEPIFKIVLFDNISGDQLLIATKNEVYAGPVELISFNPNPKK